MRLFGYELSGFVRISGTTLKICTAGTFEHSLIVAISECVKYRVTTAISEDLTANVRHFQFQPIRRDDFGRIVDYFERYLSERDTFLENFRNWEIHRSNTIRILNEVASKLHKEKNVTNKVNIVAGGAGAIGGLIKICHSISDTILPGWTRDVAKYLSILTSSLKFGTTSADYIYIETYMKTAREAIDRDKQYLNGMMRWFKYEQDLIDSIKAALGSEVTKELFEVFHICSKKITEFKSNNVKTSAIASFVVNLFIDPFIRRGLALSTGLAVGMAVFEIMFIYCGHRKWHEAARIMEGAKTIGLDALYLTNMSLNAQDFSSASTYVLAASGVIDLIPAVEAACQFFNKDSKSSDQGKHLEEVSNRLSEELRYFQELYNKILANSRRRRKSIG